jgi:hypothetical protein
MELTQFTFDEVSGLIGHLSEMLEIPVDMNYEWRSRRDSPFLQQVGTCIYIRHLRDLSSVDKLHLINMANTIVRDFDSTVISGMVSEPSISTFKFFH